jgi:hypothetical protein
LIVNLGPEVKVQVEPLNYIILQSSGKFTLALNTILYKPFKKETPTQKITILRIYGITIGGQWNHGFDTWESHVGEDFIVPGKLPYDLITKSSQWFRVVQPAMTTDLGMGWASQ